VELIKKAFEITTRPLITPPPPVLVCRVMTRGAGNKGFVRALRGYMEIRSRMPETQQIILAATCLMVRYAVRISTGAPRGSVDKQACLSVHQVKSPFSPAFAVLRVSNSVSSRCLILCLEDTGSSFFRNVGKYQTV
jgi:hypothetical protein